MFRIRSIVAATAMVAAAVVPFVTGAQAAGTVPSAVSLTAPASGVYGANITLTGRVWRYGTATAIPGATVWLQRAPHRTTAWANIKNTRTAANGNYAFAVTQTGSYDYRVYYTGSTTYRAALSPVRYPVTTQRVQFDTVASTNAWTGAVRASGWIYPLPPNGTTVYLQRWSTDGGVWRNLATGRTSNGQVVVNATRPAGPTAYRLVIPARAGLGAGISAAKWYTNWLWRGALRNGMRYHQGAGYTFGIAGTNQAAGQERIGLHVWPNRTNFATIDGYGCSRVFVDVTNTGSYLITARFYQLAGGQSDAIQLSPQQSGRMTGNLDPANKNGFYYAVENLNAGDSDADGKMWLLCTN